MTKTDHDGVEKTIREIRGATRRKHNSDEKIFSVLCSPSAVDGHLGLIE